MTNRGKKFETVVKEAFQKVEGVSIDRLHDQTNGYLGSKNICDFIVYKYPYEYYIECKSVHGNTLSLSNITDNQWKGLLEKSKIHGVYAGVLCWWIDLDITCFIFINVLLMLKNCDYKSVNGKKDIPELIEKGYWIIPIQGRKKRVFWDYDMQSLFKEVEYWTNIKIPKNFR